MAIDALPTEVIAQFKDRENTRSTTRFFLPNAGTAFVDAATLYAKALTVVELIAEISDCTLMGVKTTFSGRDDSAVGGGEVERRGVFAFAATGGTDYVTAVPSIKYGLLEPNRRDIAVRGASVTPEVQAFLDAVLTGPVGYSNGATNAAGRDLVRCLEAYKFTTGSLLERRGRSG